MPLIKIFAKIPGQKNFGFIVAIQDFINAKSKIVVLFLLQQMHFVTFVAESSYDRCSRFALKFNVSFVGMNAFFSFSRSVLDLCFGLFEFLLLLSVFNASFSYRYDFMPLFSVPASLLWLHLSFYTFAFFPCPLYWPRALAPIEAIGSVSFFHSAPAYSFLSNFNSFRLYHPHEQHIPLMLFFVAIVP